MLAGPGVVRGLIGPALGSVAADVEHQPGPRAGLPVHRQPGQILQRIEHLAVIADKLVERRPDDGDNSPVAVDVHVDVAVKVGDIEQALDVVGSYLTVLLEVGQARLRLISLIGLISSIGLISLISLVRRRVHGATLAVERLVLVHAGDVRQITGSATG